VASAESYPDDLSYHAEHDWARVEGDEAVLGITWWAQDALGEIVHYEAPAVGGSTVKDDPYGEVESVKAVSDVIAPLSGEILEVAEKLRLRQCAGNVELALESHRLWNLLEQVVDRGDADRGQHPLAIAVCDREVPGGHCSATTAR
jgi:hypothetical protein